VLIPFFLSLPPSGSGFVQNSAGRLFFGRNSPTTSGIVALPLGRIGGFPGHMRAAVVVVAIDTFERLDPGAGGFEQALRDALGDCLISRILGLTTSMKQCSISSPPMLTRVSKNHPQLDKIHLDPPTPFNTHPNNTIHNFLI
jgi:hypothetical protein